MVSRCAGFRRTWHVPIPTTAHRHTGSAAHHENVLECHRPRWHKESMQKERALSAAVIIPEAAQPVAARGFGRRVFDRWKRAAHAVGVVQTRFIMLLIYATVVVPTGVLMRLSRDPLHLRPPEQTNWTPAKQSERSVDAARQQF
jgi:hypothetical protein